MKQASNDIQHKTSLDTEILPDHAQKGRGAVANWLSTRFESETRVRVDDGWQGLYEDEENLPKKLETVIGIDTSRSVINYNDSPDLGFDRSINPYRGCEHGCVYCFARPSHAYLGFSPGLDFESRLFIKQDAPELLRKELNKPSYKPENIILGINTDAYQPIERKYEITRRIIEVFAEFRHPFTLITKSALILRDLDLIAPLAAAHLVHVCISLCTLNADLHRVMEPRAARPDKRLQVVKALTDAGVKVAVLTAPVIPAINDHEMETIMEAAVQNGATYTGYSFLRLPWELKDMFIQWLAEHFPGRKEHTLSLLREIHGGKLYNSTFGERGRGKGAYAEMVRQRYKIACRKYHLNERDDWELDVTQFRKIGDVRQMNLF
jgi:DNA repair photolyase